MYIPSLQNYYFLQHCRIKLMAQRMGKKVFWTWQNEIIMCFSGARSIIRIIAKLILKLIVELYIVWNLNS